MAERIVHTKEMVTLVGGGPIAAPDLREALSHARVPVAADGGAEPLVAVGQVPQAVIGDFDSLSNATRDAIPGDALHHISEQDSTDFEKALRRIEAPLVLGVGFLGGRLDHQLAVLGVLAQEIGPPCILIGAQEIVFPCPPQISLPLAKDDTVSLFPMTALRARSRGLAWPLDGLDLSPMGRIATSNRALGTVEVQTDGRGLLAMVPRSALGDAIAALRRPE